MWSKEPRLFKYNAGSGVSDLKEADDAHAHSPSRHESRPPVTTTGQIGNPPALNLWRNRNYQGPVPQWQGNYRESRWAPPETAFADPFVDPYMLDPAARHRGARQSWEDISMPDYISSSNSSRAISSMTGISYEHSKHPSLVAPMDEDAYSQLIQALSPPKPLSFSTHAQSNSSTTAALPMGSKLSAAAEARSQSYSKSGSHRGSISVLKDISYPGTRDVSESSVKSNTAPCDPAAATKLHPSPSGPVKSRKEGLSHENKENEAETTSKESGKLHQTPSKLNVRTGGGVETSTEGKRRRSIGSSREDCLNIGRMEPTPVSPAQGLSTVEGDDHQNEFNGFLSPRPMLMSATAEIGEME